MSADIFMSAGEASGDLQASLLLAEMRKSQPALTCRAIGSERLRAAGAQLEADSAEWASIGLFSAIAKIPKLYVKMRRTDIELRRDPPRVVIPVDFGAFNLRLARQMRSGGYRGEIIYYFPPGAWLDVEHQARAVAQSAIPLTPFAHQRDFYHGLGLRCEYFGHPLVSTIAPRQVQAAQWPAQLGIAPSAGPRIVIFPGSRREEIDRMLACIAQAAAQLASSAHASFVIAGASEARARQILQRWPAAGGGRAKPVVVRGPAIEAALSAADLAWVASGTAVLETALRAVPQIAFYALSPAQYRLVQRTLPQLANGPVTLPNLVLGRMIVPELVQDELTPRRLLERTNAILSDASEREAQARGYAELRTALGPPDTLARIARFVADTMSASAPA